MNKFRKKPVVIEAEQFFYSAERWPDGVERPDPNARGIGYGFIDTLDGRMMVADGDWVITGVKGERYPCKPDIFAATYEEEVTDEIMRITRAMWNLFDVLNEVKPNDRSPHDRRIAIAISRTEDLIANYCFWGVHQK